MKKTNLPEKIFSRKKCISNYKTSSCILRVLNFKELYDLSDHKLLFFFVIYSYGKKIVRYKICDFNFNFFKMLYLMQHMSILIYSFTKLNLYYKNVLNFRYRRSVYLFHEFNKFLKKSIDIYTNAYINMFTLKSIYLKNYDALQAKHLHYTLFNEFCVDHDNYYEHKYFFNKTYDYLAKEYFYEKFSCVNLTMHCQNSNHTVIFDSIYNFEDEFILNHNNSCLDFFFVRSKTRRYKNLFIDNSLIFFTTNKDQYLQDTMFTDSEIEDYSDFFFNKYKLVDNFTAVLDSSVFDQVAEMPACLNIYYYNYYKFFIFINVILISRCNN